MRIAANLDWLFQELAFERRFDAAAEAGFDGVELLFPTAHEPEHIAKLASDAGLPVALINAPAGRWEAGERGLAALEGRQDDFAESVAVAVRYADMLNAEMIHLMAGIATGQAARAVYVANLRRAALAHPDRTFTIEPINTRRDMPGYHLAEVDDALSVIDAVGAPNLRLQLDLYHAQVMAGDLTRRIEAAGPVIGHVQIAGVPERGEPDQGELNLRDLAETLARIGYDGWVGAEYRPAGETTAGLGWMKVWRGTA